MGLSKEACSSLLSPLYFSLLSPPPLPSFSLMPFPLSPLSSHPSLLLLPLLFSYPSSSLPSPPLPSPCPSPLVTVTGPGHYLHPLPMGSL